MSWDKNFKDRYVLIEPTDKCNLDCVMCTRGLLNIKTPHNRSLGEMDFDLFVKIIDEIEIGEQPMAIKLFWLGESLLHENFKEMLFYAFDKIKDTKAYIDLHTNAQFLNEELIDLMLLMGEKIPRVTLSLDAIKPETYKKIRRGGDFEKVMKNIHYFINKREANHLKYPAFIFQFIVQEGNKNEAKEFAEYWKGFLQKTLRKNLYDGFEELPKERQEQLLKEHGIYEKFMELENES